MIEKIYSDIRELLPLNLKKYKIEILYKGKLIDECLPNIYRKKNVDKNRLWRGIEHTSAPWVKNISRPYDVKRGLDGVHMALWQSHGRYFSSEENRWKWQRPSLFCTIEDLLTQSFVVPFLMPMLENAGAVIYTPRERDWQPLSVIVDNDACSNASRYVEYAARGNAWQAADSCYAPKEGYYIDGENPFVMGTSRVARTSTGNKRSEGTVSWLPDIPETGEYAVYVSYKTFENSVPDALYRVKHAGGVTEYKVNQTMGGGTWVYLGTHRFSGGFDKNQGVFLSTNSEYNGVVSADAVRFGGGMGNVARGDSLPVSSGLPRYLEAARYNLQTSGFPREIYSVYNGESDYRDDVNSRPHAVNYLSGGSVYNPDTIGLRVPLELSFGFHSDAGYSASDSIVGTLGVVTTDNDKDTLATGRSRYMSRDLASFMLNNVQDDLSCHYGVRWPVRGILDRKYGETRIPDIPSVIFESLSHQNFADLSYGCNPDFKFTLARSVYKSLLKHLSYVHGRKYVVQPLPVKDFSMSLSSDEEFVILRWRPVDDPQEPTAKPGRYVVYTRVGNGAFDNGVVVNEPRCVLPVAKRVLYSFKVAALNDGGESLPSEVLSLFVAKKAKAHVLVVNGFHRLSAP
ncbi:MAG: xanthan lyase, partial [Bacteroidaceae bacterium]|nr:xanthan lyase [Bacteroidaceae bacterium]